MDSRYADVGNAEMPGFQAFGGARAEF